MKLTSSILVLVCSACWIQATWAQTTDDPTEPRCGGRGLGNLIPAIVGDLPEVCSAADLGDTPQCCSRDYILQRLNTTEEDFRAALRDELQTRFRRFRDMADRLTTFLDGDFLDGLFASFADLSYLQRRGNVVAESADEFRQNFDIERAREALEGQDFNVMEFLERFIQRIEDEAITEFASTQLSSIQECVKNVIQGKVSEVRMTAFAAAVEQVRRVRTTLDKLTGFLDGLNTTLGGFQPLSVCVNRLVELADCDSCIVPRVLCSNWCGALAKACYSPFYDTFNDQFRRFWPIVQRTFNSLPGLWRRLNDNRRVIDINFGQFRSALSECAEDLVNDFLSGLGKRQASDGSDNTPTLPSTPNFDLGDLTGGAFEYDRSGPRLCRSFSITTRSARCWDGDNERDNDIPSFETDSIDGQDENPAIVIPSSDLQAQAAALGSPVDTLINDPTFIGTAPEGVAGSGGALTVTVSLLLVSVMAALGMMN
ncbi:uncharacterized protein LOC135345810 [Halichondria panicea]|uniref:uncharacterized protein LOC135345810 n=1 Tax=Halichondria panicea TaxID=6063 RepID=UPI00312B7341